MNPGFQRSISARRRRAAVAFTVLELLLAVSLTSLIVFALYSMFNQTQRALRSNVNQVDVMEGGRASTEFLTREMEQIAPCYLANGTNLVAHISPLTTPLIQSLPAGTNKVEDRRTNIIQEVFFLTRSNNFWIGTGYRVMDSVRGAGSLHRYAVATNVSRLTRSNLYTMVMGADATNFVRVADGIIHLRVRAFDAVGQEMTAARERTYGDPNILLKTDPRDLPSKLQTMLMFQNYALPAYLDIELGVLAPSTLEQFRSIPNEKAARDYLAAQSGSVSLFRQRVPIRTAPR